MGSALVETFGNTVQKHILIASGNTDSQNTSLAPFHEQGKFSDGSSPRESLSSKC